jgi:alpha-glucosidase
MRRRPRFFFVCAVCGAAALLMIPADSAGAAGTAFSLKSPDGRIEVNVTVGADIRYGVRFQGTEIVSPSAIAMTLEGGKVLGAAPRVKDEKRRTVDETLRPVVKQKSAAIRDHFNELVLSFAGGFDLVFRAYDDGAAYRFATSLPSPITVVSERAEFAFPKDHKVYFAEEQSYQTHQERASQLVSLSAVTAKKFSLVPVIVDVEGGPKVAITEADLEDYAGLYLTGVEGAPTTLAGKFPAVALKEQAKNDRDVLVTERAPYLARTSGRRSFPWRVLVIAEKDAGLIESTLVYRLAKPAQGDFSWVRPGKVAWDWWNDLNLAGVDFRAGVNTATYQYFIDFAAAHGIEYVILDEGWYKLGDLLTLNPAIDMEAILARARAKNVGIIPWVIWKTLDDQLAPAMEMFAKWGVAGLKVDFMQRDDQAVVNYYYRIAAEAAKRRLLIDFHGAYKPTGLYRTFPNVITSEGVMGLEHSKWSKTITPEHDVTLPFTRMLAGPMDFTPGAMINGTQRGFQPIYNQPMSQGTRCHQLAMYVVYESPLQMLADSPTNYLREPECLSFLSAVPTVWDETRVLDAKIADYVLVARRNGSAWYLGAMTDWTAREMTVDLSFLGPGRFEMTAYRDGLNADRNAADYRMTTAAVTRADKPAIKLAPGGGWAARIVPGR